MTKYANIVFMQGDEGHDVIDDILYGPLAGFGPTVESIQATVDHLVQWDYGDDDDARGEPSRGERDCYQRVGEYVLTWNFGLGYVGLERILESE